MAEKAKNTKNNSKNLIIGICVAVVVVVVVAVAAFFATRGTGQAINDSYFVSDGTKYVLTVEGAMLDTSEDDEYPPVKTHLVYTYSGDNITGMFTYLEFADEATAKAALNYYKQADQSGVKSISTNGKYLVVEMTEDQYSDMKASEVKDYLDLMNSLQNTDVDDYEYEEYDSTTDNLE